MTASVKQERHRRKRRKIASRFIPGGKNRLLIKFRVEKNRALLFSGLRNIDVVLG
jgi:hypothetical protein